MKFEKQLSIIVTLSLLSITCFNCKAQNTSHTHISIKNEDSDAREFVKSCLKWYKTRIHYINTSIHFVDINMQRPTTYRINYNETEKYLSILKSSSFFSDKYLNYYRSYFQKIDSNFQKTKQDDGEPEGLDFDLIMHSQEPESILQNLNEIHLIVLKSSTNDKVLVKMKTKFDLNAFSLFELSKTNNSYIIDKIEFVAYPKR